MIRFNFRPVYEKGRPAAWVQTLRRASGVYVIRCAVSKQVLYVGESHTGRLAKTLLRHFQRWKADSLGREHHTYNPRLIEAAAVRTGAAGAVRTQDGLIVAFDPRDNLTGK